MTVHHVSAVVLAYGAEPLLHECVTALLASEGADVEVVVVDNGCTGSGVRDLEGTAGVRVLRPEHNTGYAGGCRMGAAASTRPMLALVNSDAVVSAGALAALARAADEPRVGIATASIRLHEDPLTMNSAGNPVHFLLLAWAGGHGDPASQHADVADVASASGATCLLRREIWEDLDGFAEVYFAYHEDTDLSLRCWQRGLRVVYVPDAVVTHDYAFSRHPTKMYLLERNRLLTMLTVLERRTLLVLAPAALMLEVGLLLLSVRQGWWRQKVLGWWWLLRHAGAIASRRRQVQAGRLLGDGDLAGLFESRFDGRAFDLPPVLGTADRVLAAYWRVARRLLRRSVSDTGEGSAGGNLPA